MSIDGAFDVLDNFRTCRIAGVDDSKDYGEQRWVGIASLGEGLLHTAVFTEIGEERVRIISLRRSTTQEVHTYATQKGKK